MSPDLLTAKRNAVCEALREYPVIAAVKSADEAEAAKASSCSVVFLLQSSLGTLARDIAAYKRAGKWVFLHLDLVDGLQTKDVAVDFLAQNTEVDGLISTRESVLKRAREVGLLTVHRFFVVDSLSLANLREAAHKPRADFIDILPGLMPRILQQFTETSPVPVLTGGLIQQKADVIAALQAGVLAVSTTDPAVWEL